MSLRPESLRGASPSSAGTGTIDYRLARQALISEYRKGRLARHEVCDAHPELLRVARNCGSSTQRTCPICEESALCLVTFAFGTRLPAQGKFVSSAAELAKLSRRPYEAACYVVEVCPGCSWNHLTRTFLVGRPRPQR